VPPLSDRTGVLQVFAQILSTRTYTHALCLSLSLSLSLSFSFSLCLSLSLTHTHTHTLVTHSITHLNIQIHTNFLLRHTHANTSVSLSRQCAHTLACSIARGGVCKLLCIFPRNVFPQRALCFCERALRFCKKAKYFCRIALYFCNRALNFVAHICAHVYACMHSSSSSETLFVDLLSTDTCGRGISRERERLCAVMLYLRIYVYVCMDICMSNPSSSDLCASSTCFVCRPLCCINSWRGLFVILIYIAVCCIVLQCLAVSCRVGQCLAYLHRGGLSEIILIIRIHVCI